MHAYMNVNEGVVRLIGITHYHSYLRFSSFAFLSSQVGTSDKILLLREIATVDG